MNVPQLRFSGFDEEWHFKNLNEVVTLFGGNAFQSKDATAFGVKWLKIANVGYGKTVWKDISFLPYEYVEKYQRYLLVEGDIVMALTRPIINGKLKIATLGEKDIPSLLNQRVAKLVFSENTNEKFIYHLLRKRKVVAEIESLISGTDPPNIGNGEMKKIGVLLPSKVEQEKISSFLNLLDNKMQIQQEKIEILEQFKKGMMQKIFSQELRFRDDDGGEFGEWETKQLKEFATKTFKKNKDMKVTNVISNSAKQGLISQRSYFKKDIANELNIDGYYVISKGDFVYNPRISSESPYGPVHVYELEDDGIVSPLYLCFETRNIDSKFLKYFFMSSLWYKHIYTHGDSGARHDRVSIKDAAFFEMKMSVPSLAEQEKISVILDALHLKVEKEKEKLMILEEQKKGFMQGMFV